MNDLEWEGIQRLLLAVLKDGIENCCWRKEYRVEACEWIVVPDERGSRRRRVSRWCLCEVWVRDKRDLDWLYDNSHRYNSFLELCELFDVNSRSVRERVEVKPEGWSADKKILAYSSRCGDMHNEKSRLVRLGKKPESDI